MFKDSPIGKTYFYCPACGKVTDGSKHKDNNGYIH